MSDLENQVETTEELVVEKAPTDGAEKGDKSAHKQGSSDAEKIESGKAEVVKPEENPVDAAVCLLYTSPSPRDAHESRMPSSA